MGRQNRSKKNKEEIRLKSFFKKYKYARQHKGIMYVFLENAKQKALLI